MAVLHDVAEGQAATGSSSGTLEHFVEGGGAGSLDELGEEVFLQGLVGQGGAAAQDGVRSRRGRP